jgi:DNA-directed RNA polymerase subunit M/transcription elongation factor TFIIS
MSEVMARRALAVNFVDVKAGNIVEVKAEKVAEAESADERVHCDECGSDEVYRLFRQGFFQEKIYPMAGFYPWRCKKCGLCLMLRKRNLANKQDSTE